MSAEIGTTAKSNGTSKGPSAEPATNPFDTPFDGDDSDRDAYEWWDDGESTPPTKPKSSKLLESNGGSNVKNLNRNNTRKTDKRYSVHKPIRHKSRGRQRKQNAKAGIKVVTDFSARNPAPAQLQAPKQNAQPGCFVDLAALDALNGGPKQKTGGFWKSLKNKEPAAVPMSRPAPTQATLAPTPHDPYDDLSPNDRPIFIGLSIPSRDVSMHPISPQTASSETSNIVRSYQHRTPNMQVPETPTIVITPANEGSTWSPFDEGSLYNGQKPSATSSFYSQASIDQHRAAPPVPKVPTTVLKEEQQRIAAQKSCFSPDTEDGTVWEDESVNSRVVSSCTIFEEDVSPIIVRTARGVSVSDGSKSGDFATPSTPRRHSKGWWNYITTPFLTRSNTFASIMRDPQRQQPPALPNLAIAAAAAHEAERDGKTWEKQFSPLTPATSTTIQSDSWWNVEPNDVKSPVDRKSGHKVQVSAVTVPFVFSGDAPSSPRQLESPVTNFPSSGPGSNDRDILTLPLENNSGALQSNNPFIRPESSISSRREVVPPAPVVVMQQPQQPQTIIVNNHTHESPSSDSPPPAYSPPQSRVPRYRAVFPPGHAMEQPMSPGPITPGMQNAMAGPGAVQMDNVPLTPAPTRTPMNLNSSYSSQPPPRGNGPVTAAYFEPPPKKAKKAEAKRRRHEKEDAAAHKAGGLWRGRGCIPKRGCSGRKGAEGRKKRRCYFCIILGFLLMIILAIVLATQLHRKSNPRIEASQWVNLTGFPPIFAGLSTVVAPTNTVANTGCIAPAAIWSCDLPREIQGDVRPNGSNQPNFLFNILWDNSTETNATFANVTGNPKLPTRALGGNAVSAGQFVTRMLGKAKRAVTIVPSPAPPSLAENFFLGNTTDGIISPQKAGEPTPFYISLLQPEKSNLTKRALSSLVSRQTDNTSDPFPDLDKLIPPPSTNPDGTAAPANLLTLPSQQPIRLYDRGLPTEHYGFYTYYDRSIYLTSIDPLNTTSLDLPGGAPKSQAAFRCTWTQTRLLVQIWTRRNGTAQLLNSTHPTGNLNKDPGHDYSQPGSFPYPVTVTVDRHGGDAGKKLLYCYPLDKEGRNVSEGRKVLIEQRGFGGRVVNPANSIFGGAVSDPGLGGFDGGDGGCKCGWENFKGLN